MIGNYWEKIGQARQSSPLSRHPTVEPVILKSRSSKANNNVYKGHAGTTSAEEDDILSMAHQFIREGKMASASPLESLDKSYLSPNKDAVRKGEGEGKTHQGNH